MKPTFRPLPLILAGFAACNATAQDRPSGNAGDPALQQAPVGLRADPELVKLVPWPMRGTLANATVPLDPAARIVAASPELTPLANILAGEIVRLTQRAIQVAQGPATPPENLRAMLRAARQG